MHALRVGRRRRQLLGDAARRRHRLGQDRGLFRGGRAHAASGAAGADHAARDRAHQPVHATASPARFGCPPVEWHSALSAARARPRLARRGNGRGARRRRRPLGAVPALQGARPHRRRRGARRRLQAGGPRALPGARHGRGARQPRQLPGRALLGDAVDREPRQCPHRPLSPRGAAGALLGRRAARRDGHRSAPAIRPSAASGCRRRSSRPSPRRWQRSSRRCCSSTAAAMRR